MANPEWENYAPPQQRYRLMSDNDGHKYIIPVGQEDNFYSWVEGEEEGIDSKFNFEAQMLGGSRLTFTDPKED